MKSIKNSINKNNEYNNLKFKENDIHEYKIIYDITDNNKFTEDSEDLKFSIEINSNKIEENSNESKFEDFINNMNLKEDEEFPLDGKLFDNLNEDKMKIKQEKIEKNFHSIIKKHNAQNTNVPSKHRYSYDFEKTVTFDLKEKNFGNLKKYLLLFIIL